MDNLHFAHAAFDSGLNCCQAVVAKYARQYGWPEDALLAAAAGFGGGMKQAEHCGAVTGAYMVLGLLADGDAPDNQQLKDQAGAGVLAFNERFLRRYDTLLCRELLGHDPTTEAGRAAIRAADLNRSICRPAVAVALDILDDLHGQGWQPPVR